MSVSIPKPAVEHTPLPWSLWMDENGAYTIEKLENHSQRPGMGMVIAGRSPIPFKAAEMRANARVLFAGPYLLKACIDLREVLRHNMVVTKQERPLSDAENQKYIDAARAVDVAISKAFGA